MLMLDFKPNPLLPYDALNEVLWLSTITSSSLQGFELFYEELPSVKRVARVRRQRVS